GASYIWTMLDRRRLAITLVVATVGTSAASRAHAAPECRLLEFSFQPVPYSAAHEFPSEGIPSHGIPRNAILEEGGPQVAIWLESAPPTGAPPAQRGSFIADIFITNRTGQFGIGNRPGNAMFGSSPRFPYGSRENVLPVWAWARASVENYPQLVMQDGLDES